MGKFGLPLPPLAAVIAAIALAGCGGGMRQQAPQAVEQLPAPEVPPTIRVSEIVGRWGYAAYHRAEDRARTEAAARGQCRQAVVINAGPTGGVLYVMASFADRGRQLATYHAVRRAIPAQAHQLIAGALPPLIASVLTTDEIETVRQRLLALPEPATQARLTSAFGEAAAPPSAVARAHNPSVHRQLPRAPHGPQR